GTTGSPWCADMAMSHEVTVWDLAVAAAEQWPDRIAWVDQREQSITFAELLERATEIAAGLAQRGIDRQATVAWQLPTWPEAYLLTLALCRLDVVQVPLLPIYRQRELGHILET